MRNTFIATLLTFFFTTISTSQTTINQNGLQSTVIPQLSAGNTQPKRYEIANIGYNSYHWQYGGIIIVEIFQTYFSTDYQKYIIENGFGQGANSGTATIKLVDSHGINHSGKITLGTPSDLNTSFGGYINKQIPILFDVQYYAIYNIKITYSHQKVDEINSLNQIKINENPTGVDIPNFSVSTDLNTNLNIVGQGNHYIQNGNFGIGTTIPDEKLTVKGKIHTQEVRVDMAGPLVPDYVFANDYKLKPLQEVENYINKNKHLPEIPSATDIEKNGLMLAEMNMALLKKMEEMTLYIIEQNKKINELEIKNKKFEDIENRLKKLESKTE